MHVNEVGQGFTEGGDALLAESKDHTLDAGAISDSGEIVPSPEAGAAVTADRASRRTALRLSSPLPT